MSTPPRVAALAILLPLHLAAAPQSTEDSTALVAQEFMSGLSAAVDAEESPDLEALEGLFDAQLRALLSRKALSGIVRDLGDEGPAVVELLSSEPAPEGRGVQFVYELVQDDSNWIHTLTVDAQERVSGWFYRPGPRHRSRADLLRELADLDGDWGASYLLLDSQGAATELLEVNVGRTVFPLGSVFKLYVLAELSRRVASGDIDLDSGLEIRDALKSLPSGVLQDEDEGVEIPIGKAAELMIAISDNTATDHLMALVGRDAVEASLPEFRNSCPELNAPFLSTREMFLFKACGRAARESAMEVPNLGEAAQLWSAADRSQRLFWLSALEEGLSELSGDELRAKLLAGYGPASLDGRHLLVEWFARPNDIVALLHDAHRGQLVDEATSRVFLELLAHGTNRYPRPGVAEDGSKGGNETGLVCFAQRVVLDDGRAVLGCLARSGYNPIYPNTITDTARLHGELIRNLFDGEPVPEKKHRPRPARDAADEDPKEDS